MPLMAKLHQIRDREREMDLNMNAHDASLQVPRSRSKDSGYEGFEEYKNDECVDSDMEGSILHRARPKKVVRAPALPARSEKRASTMLKDVMLELQNLDGSRVKDMEEVPMAEEKDPHELYLSSEEDASLSDYEDSDSLVDFEPLEGEELEADLKVPASRGSSRKSQEVTARAVSFTMVKPMIVDISPSTNTSPCTPPRPSSSTFESHMRSRPSSIIEAGSVQTRSGSPSRPAPRRPSPLKLHTSSIRRMSVSSIASLTQTSTNSSSAAPSMKSTNRKSTRMANLASLVTHSLHKTSSHAFLSTDPFPSAQSSPALPQENERPETPKTPTSMAAAAFKKGLTRSLHRARKPSLQKLNSSFTSRNSSMLNLSTTATPSSQPIPDPSPARQRRKSLAFPTQASVPESGVPPMPLTPQTPHEGPLRYQDIMKGVIHSPPPAQQKKASPGRGKSILGLGRRKSVRA